MNKVSQKVEVKVGEVWLTKSVPCLPDGKSLLAVHHPAHVVILLDDKEAYDTGCPDIRVAPISMEVAYASDMDLVVPGHQNPLKVVIMIELWNSQPMLKMNLDEYCGSLSDGVIKQLGILQQKLWGMEVNTESFNTGEPIIRDDDRRIAFQEREIEKTLYLRGPVNDLLEKWEHAERLSLSQAQVEELYRRVVSVGSSIYTILASPARNVEMVGVAGAPRDRGQIYENESFRGEIYKEENALFLDMAATIETLIGKFVAVSVPSANKVDYDPDIIKWKQEGPDKIVSDNPLDPGGRVRIKIAETKLDPDKEEDSRLLRRVFAEIELEIFDAEDES